MCGMIGFHAKTGSWVSYKQREDWLKTMMTVCSLRGEDSAGIALLQEDEKSPEVYKGAVPPWYFINSPIMSKVEARLFNAHTLLGHCRAATQGAITDNNAHPFKFGSVTLTHNGTIPKHAIETPVDRSATTDSAMLAALLAEADVDKAHEVLENTGGAWAIVWYDERDCSLNFARNAERPLWFGSTPDHKILMWASERWMLSAGQARGGNTFDEIEVTVVPLQKHLKYYVEEGTLRAFVRPIKEYVSSWTTKTYPTHTPQANQAPSWVKNGMAISFVVDSFQPYTAAAATGNLVGTIVDGDATVRIVCHGFPQSSWNNYRNVTDPVFSGIISGYSSAWAGGVKTETVTVRDAAYVSTLKKYKRKAETNNIVPLHNKGPDKIKGPQGYITIKEFMAITSDGCSWCGTDITTTEAEFMKWEKGNKPLCAVCTQEDALQEAVYLN